MSGKGTSSESKAIISRDWLDQKLYFYKVRALNKDVVKYPDWNEQIQIPFGAQCVLMFKQLSEKLDKKYHVKLNKLERKIRRATKLLFFQPSEEKNKVFKKRYLEILAEGEVVFKDEQNIWGDCMRPVLVCFANLVIAGVQFVLSAFIPSARDYKGAFFADPGHQTREEASHIWKQELEALQEKFYEISDHAVTLS
jgi:hypothetical protein